jgi:transposase
MKDWKKIARKILNNIIEYLEDIFTPNEIEDFIRIMKEFALLVVEEQKKLLQTKLLNYKNLIIENMQVKNLY